MKLYVLCILHVFTTYNQQMHNLIHSSMPQCIIIFGEFFCYTEVTSHLNCSPLAHTLRVLKDYHNQAINIL